MLEKHSLRSIVRNCPWLEWGNDHGIIRAVFLPSIPESVVQWLIRNGGGQFSSEMVLPAKSAVR
jgi:hypothetical protein